MGKRVFVVVVDGCGCGELPDAGLFKDAGANTLGNCSKAVGGLRLPVLQALGLGNITAIDGVSPTTTPLASYGKCVEQSVMKDTPTGHGEMMGVITKDPWAFFPDGFPQSYLDEFCAAAHVGGVLGNKAISGTVIIKELGQEHERTGWPIVYTSGDSVFQIAAHQSIIPLERLSEMCVAARVLCDKWNIGRVISRPFIGAYPNYERTKNRHDWTKPMPPHLLDCLVAAGVPVVTVGKLGDIFAHRSTGREMPTGRNEVGLLKLSELIGTLSDGFVFANLLDTDDECGHRRDPQKFAACLSEIDTWLGYYAIPMLRGGDTLILTADHGNDPTFAAHTDHTREHVPLIVVNPGGANVDLGVRGSFADIGATIADIFNVPALAAGESFLRSIRR